MSALVPLPFAEAIAWAKARGVVLPDEYYGELQGLARALAFSIANIAQLDQLLLVHQSLVDALERGDSIQAWKDWATSDDSPLRGLPSYRIENIFRTNIQSEYARGRCEQARRNTEAFPWLLYDAVNDSRTRPSHAAMDGLVVRYDDPILNTWRPPCGYQCRCRVIPLTDAMAQQYIDADARKQLDVSPQELFGGLTHAEARQIAIVGGPDKGWDYDVCQEPDAGVRAAERRARGAAQDTPLLAPLLSRLADAPVVQEEI
jgi:SPP1 gp7 family putative phage head morphogenesis protein